MGAPGNGNPFQIHQSVNLDHGTFTGQQSYSYDTLDRLRSFQTLYGETLQYTYDLRLPSAVQRRERSVRIRFSWRVFRLSVIAGLLPNGEKRVRGSEDQREPVDVRQMGVPGNRTELLDHDGRLTRYTYDEVNRLTAVNLPSQPDDITIGYYPNNRIETLSYPNGATVNYTYDAADRVDVIDNTVMGSTVTKHDYDYDLNGNRTQLDEQNGNGTEITTYQYDRDDRMTVVAYPDHTASYVLDPVGNRTEEQLTGSQNLTRSYVYNTRDQLTNVSDTTGLNIDYTFDENGNQVSKTEAAATTTFQYTPRNRMATVTLQGAPPIHYGYNPQGLRVNKQTPGAETRYIYDDTALIAETNVLGNTIARYHYSADRKVAYTKSGTTLFYFQDALGTPTAITRADGGINARMTHDVWGQVVRETGTNDQPFSFTGYQRDPETGLLYAQQRYYSAMEARFLREDPFAGDINTPPSLHRYLYAYGNPAIYIDPDGRIGFLTDLRDSFDHTDRILREHAMQSSGLTSVGLNLARTLNSVASLGPRLVNVASDAVALGTGIIPGFEMVARTGGTEFGDTVDSTVAFLNMRVDDAVVAGHSAAVNKFSSVLEGDRGAASDMFVFFGDSLSGAGAAKLRNLGQLDLGPTRLSRADIEALRRLDPNKQSPSNIVVSEALERPGVEVGQRQQPRNALGQFQSPDAGGDEIASLVERGQSSTLLQQRELARFTADARAELLNNFEDLLGQLSGSQVDAIVENPWLFRMFVGTAIEERVAAKVRSVQQSESAVFNDVRWTERTNAPQDFLTRSGYGFEVTAGSSSSILRHQSRPEVDAVVTYEPVPSDMVFEFLYWLENN